MRKRVRIIHKAGDKPEVHAARKLEEERYCPGFQDDYRPLVFEPQT